ncbi:hypothetical protein PR202_ga06309 [Eleusine coracana subsp. coracana]|uniref:RRM domain-containing protein n=1 Tax=Eleusine coracana subsp. coracana TaxID=191504 RepID=A0AAV5BV28_ELECO|nr:hypothetical protein PR202_ga06309 [Eleusine coracana subsp. coracana]
MRPVFCGNLDYDVRISEIERLFGKYGRVERVDLKTGFAFVYMEDERDGDDAIRKLDGIEFGRKGRRIRVEWTKEDRSAGRRGGSRKSPNSARPTKTLFVINFDPMNTRTRDLERHFDKYGRIANVRIKKNFAFVQFEVQEDATRALEGTNGSAFMDRVISVEYALRDDDEKRNGYSPDRRGRERRSPSPYGRGRERVAQTTAGAGRGGAQTTAGEATNVALTMAMKQAQMVGPEVMTGAAPTMNGSVVKLALVVSAMKVVLAGSDGKLVLAGSAGKLVLTGSAGKLVLARSAGKQVLAMTAPLGHLQGMRGIEFGSFSSVLELEPSVSVECVN